MEGLKAEVAEELFGIGAIQFGAFKLKHHERDPTAPDSPIWLQLRTADHPTNPGPLTPELTEKIGDLFGQVILEQSLTFDCFAGIPEAGEPFADQVERISRGWRHRPSHLHLHKLNLPDGQRRITSEIDGIFDAGEVVLLVDDLITQADSKLEAIDALDYCGLEVQDILVLVDRQQGGRQEIEDNGFFLHSVFTLDELLDCYVKQRLIAAEKADEVRAYLAANTQQGSHPPTT